MHHPLMLRLGAAVTVALLLPACAATTPSWDSRFGDSVRATVASQVADPAAARNTNPVRGIDGRAARAAQERYERAFVQPPVDSGATLLGTK